MVLKVKFPPGFQEERSYTFKVLLFEILGLTYTTEINPAADSYIIEVGEKRILIEDSFFLRYKSPEEYLNINSIPKNVDAFSYSDFANILCLYGTPFEEVSPDVVRCRVDLIAGAYFMLSRWEEYVRTERDTHGRFPARSSLASIHGFLTRPIVNEYAIYLKYHLMRMGVPESAFVQRQFKFHLHCDVDTALYWRSPVDIFRKIGFRLFREKSAGKAVGEFSGYLRYLRDGRDPYDNFDLLMDFAERIGSQATFFFPVSNRHAEDCKQLLSDKHVQSVFSHVIMRGHLTGVHPGYLSFNHVGTLQTDVGLYSKYNTDSILRSRQHFLRCASPETWSLWDEVGIDIDSTLGYPEEPGFRCGICQSFTLFNCLTRQVLQVRELPLVAMDVSFRYYLDQSPEETISSCVELIRTVQRYHGDFVLLWHNSSFGQDWRGWEDVPTRVVEATFIAQGS